MQLTDTVVVRDANGNIQSGLTLTWYKHGETTGGIEGTEDSDLAGQYNVIIPDTYIAKSYDIYITGGLYNPYIEGRVIGKWEWEVRNYNGTDGATINFADLTDIHGDALPTTIENAVIVLTCKDDRLAYIDNITSTGFDLHFSVAGSTDKLIDLYITIG